MGRKAVGPVCCVMHVKEPRTLIVKENGLAPVFLDLCLEHPAGWICARYKSYYYYNYYVLLLSNDCWIFNAKHINREIPQTQCPMTALSISSDLLPSTVHAWCKYSPIHSVKTNELMLDLNLHCLWRIIAERTSSPNSQPHRDQSIDVMKTF